MCEEIRNPGAEINEAELENVSGGEDPRARLWAHGMCTACLQTDFSKRECYNSNQRNLALYYEERGNIRVFTTCPYYNR